MTTTCKTEGRIGLWKWHLEPDDGRYGFGCYAVVIAPNYTVKYKVWYPSGKRAEHAAIAFIQSLFDGAA